MNTFLNQMKRDNNIGYTENGGVTRKTTNSKVLDMFALGGAYRTRSDADVILLFKNAFEEDANLAMKCLFYLRDILEGQGERRFFKVVFHWLAINCPEVARKNYKLIPIYGRYDDLYCLVDTPLEKEMFRFMKHEVAEGLKILHEIE